MTAKTVLFKNATIITMDSEIGTLENADLLIKDGRIENVGQGIESSEAEIIDATGKILHPGFVDTHRHVWQSLLRGVAADWTIVDYMVEMRSQYCVCFEPEDAYLGNYVGGLEAVNAGVTSIIDHSHLQISPDHSDALAKGLLDSGVGGFHCYGFYNNPEYKPGGPVDVEKETRNLVEVAQDWHFENGKRIRETYFPDDDSVLRFGVATSEIFWLPMEEALIEIDKAREIGAGCVSMHWGVATAVRGIPNMIKELEDAGKLGDDLLMVHCNDFTDEEFKICARNGVGISATPDTELGMGIGYPIHARALEGGADVGFGVDICSYIAGDMFGQIRLGLQVQRWEDVRPSEGKPVQIANLKEMTIDTYNYLEVATLGGAKAIGLGDEIGSLTPGKRADVVVVNTDGINIAPVQDPVAAIVFYANIHDIEAVLINGEFKKKDGKLVGVDMVELTRKVKETGKQLIERHALIDYETTMNIWREQMMGDISH